MWGDRMRGKQMKKGYAGTDFGGYDRENVSQIVKIWRWRYDPKKVQLALACTLHILCSYYPMKTRKLCGFFVIFLRKFSSIQGWMMLDGYLASSCHLLRRITAIKTPKNLNKILFSDLCMSLSKPTKLQTVIINHDAANGKMGWHVNHTNIK